MRPLWRCHCCGACDEAAWERQWWPSLRGSISSATEPASPSFSTITKVGSRRTTWPIPSPVISWPGTQRKNRGFRRPSSYWPTVSRNPSRQSARPHSHTKGSVCSDAPSRFHAFSTFSFAARKRASFSAMRRTVSSSRAAVSESSATGIRFLRNLGGQSRPLRHDQKLPLCPASRRLDELHVGNLVSRDDKELIGVRPHPLVVLGRDADHLVAPGMTAFADEQQLLEPCLIHKSIPLLVREPEQRLITADPLHRLVVHASSPAI